MSEGALIVPAEDGGLSMLIHAPFVPGEGPFKVKGNAYRGHMSYVERYVPGGLMAHADALRSLSEEHGEAWVRFFDRPFVDSQWYDIYPMAIAGAACARLTGEDFLSFVYNRSCAQAREDIGGAFRFLLRFVSARNIAQRVPGLMATYFNFVTVESEVLDEYTLRSTFSGTPVALEQWLAAVAEGYIATVVEVAGNQRPRSRPGEVREAGLVHGVRVCLSRGEVSVGGFDRNTGF